jgi:hypothetical protein
MKTIELQAKPLDEKRGEFRNIFFNVALIFTLEPLDNKQCVLNNEYLVEANVFEVLKAIATTERNDLEYADEEWLEAEKEREAEEMRRAVENAKTTS